MPVFDELFPIVATPDVARALRFYRDQLGGTVTYQFPDEGDPAYVSVRIGVSAVGITRQTEPGTTANDRISLWLYAEDCDAGSRRPARRSRHRGAGAAGPAVGRANGDSARSRQ